MEDAVRYESITCIMWLLDQIESVASGIWHGITGSGSGTPSGSPGATPGAAGGDKLAEDPQVAQMAAARAALADKFKVGADGNAPNNVSPEEFEKMAKLYADIGNGRSNFTFDEKGNFGEWTPPDEFKQNAMGDFAKMMQTKGGREMLTSLAYGEHEGGEKDALDKEIKMIYHNDPGKAHESSTAWNGSEWAKTPYMGVQYTPGKDFDNCHNHFDSDTILFHELVHAYHDRAGTLPDKNSTVSKPTHEFDKDLDAAEYQAVGLGDHDHYHTNEKFNENAYRAERRAMGETDEERDRYRGKPLDMTDPTCDPTWR